MISQYDFTFGDIFLRRHICYVPEALWTWHTLWKYQIYIFTVSQRNSVISQYVRNNIDIVLTFNCSLQIISIECMNGLDRNSRLCWWKMVLITLRYCHTKCSVWNLNLFSGCRDHETTLDSKATFTLCCCVAYLYCLLLLTRQVVTDKHIMHTLMVNCIRKLLINIQHRCLLFSLHTSFVVSELKFVKNNA